MEERTQDWLSAIHSGPCPSAAQCSRAGSTAVHSQCTVDLYAQLVLLPPRGWLVAPLPRYACLSVAEPPNCTNTSACAWHMTVIRCCVAQARLRQVGADPAALAIWMIRS